MPNLDRPLYDFLAGPWTIRREIDDHYGSQRGVFEGSATFQPTEAPDTLVYCETGTLTLGTQEHAAERSYRWQCNSANSADVYFHDGRFFHAFELTGGNATAEHLCGEDLYTGSYCIETGDKWRVIWRVTGPRKDYTMDNTYTRA